MLTVVSVLALVLAYIALVAAYLALRTLARLRRAAAILARPDGNESIVEAAERHIAMTASVAGEIESLRAELAETRAALDVELAQTRDATSKDLAAEKSTTSRQLSYISKRIDADAARSLRNVALIRYDAFDDMAGRMSFSLALLDDQGDGVTLTSIAARGDTRIYAKGISRGAGQSDLTPEEIQAVGAALRSTSAKVERDTRRRAS